jgi:hypothetical protein
MYLVAIINTKMINSILKLNSAFNYNIEGIPLSSVINNKL